MLGRDPVEYQKRIMKASNKQEKRTAQKYGGSRQPRSGAGWIKKNDVRADNFLIENKLTMNAKYYTVKSDDLRALAANALKEDRMPVLQFDLGGKSFVILQEDDFLEMCGE